MLYPNLPATISPEAPDDDIIVLMPALKSVFKKRTTNPLLKLAGAIAGSAGRVLQRFTKILNFIFKRRRRVPEPRRLYPKENFPWFWRLSFLFLPLLFLFGFFYSDLFKIDRVVVSWDRPDFYENRVEKLFAAELRGRNLWLTLPQYSKFKSKLPPSIETFSVSRTFPKTIKISLQTRRPLAVVSPITDDLRQASLSAIIKNDLLGEAAKNRRANAADFLVDEKGLVFAQSPASPSGLPQIILSPDKSGPRLGVSLAGEIPFNFLRNYLGMASEQNLPPLLAILTQGPQDLLVRTGGGNYFIFAKNFGQKDSLGALGLILNKYSVEGKKLRKVDLRFNNPVVEY